MPTSIEYSISGLGNVEFGFYNKELNIDFSSDGSRRYATGNAKFKRLESIGVENYVLSKETLNNSCIIRVEYIPDSGAIPRQVKIRYRKGDL
jgi:hypothetical protein